MAVATAEERQRFVRLAHRNCDLVSFFDAVDRALAASVPFDGSCWLSLDPATLLPTSHFTREFGFEHLMLLASNEYVEDDVNKFAALARATPPVGVLSHVTGGDLHRSARYSNVLAPHGYGEGDELRATFLDGNTAWGCVAIHRRQGTFDEREAGIVADIGRSIGDGIRRAILANAVAPNTVAPGAGPSAPGLVILSGNDSIEGMTPAAIQWIAEMVDATGDAGAVPLILVTLASVARRAGAGQTEDVARARLPTRSGGLLLVHASVLDGPDDRVAIMLDPARAPALPALFVEAYVCRSRNGSSPDASCRAARPRRSPMSCTCPLTRCRITSSPSSRRSVSGVAGSWSLSCSPGITRQGSQPATASGRMAGSPTETVRHIESPGRVPILDNR
jgi:hypothetical protein